MLNKINPSTKICFMHINKTSGDSTRRWFNQNSYYLGNEPPHYYHRPIEVSEYSNIFYFTIVRNPYDRVASHWLAWSESNDAMHTLKDVNHYLSELHKDPHNIRNFFKKDKVHLWDSPETPGFPMTQPCSYWIKELNRFTVFKFEEQEKMIKYFKDQGFVFNIELSSLRYGVTKNLSSYKHLYTDKSIKLIQEIFAEDFDNFSYER